MTEKTEKKPEAKNAKEQQTATATKEEKTEAAETEAKAKQEPAQDKAQEYYQQLIRLQADFENYRKRNEREKPFLIEYGKAETVKSFLGLYDTVIKAQEETSKEGTEIKHIRQGLKMIFDEFNKVFAAAGVKIVESKGKPYDPMTQEVVTTIPCEDKDDCLVLQELKKGVTMDGKMIRAAQVIVGKKKEAPSKEQK
jgi:molecular chaperone GrpE